MMFMRNLSTRILPLVCISAMAAFSCKVEEAPETVQGNIDVQLPPPEGDASEIDTRLFEVIDMDYPGLEKVKASYVQEDYYAAAAYLLDYYRNRTSVQNPLIDMVATTASDSDVNIADQATAEGGYRFYIRNYEEGTNPANGLPLYWSFADGNGGIDWDFVPDGLTERQFMIQKHRHQWMEPQAKVYRVTRDEKYVEAWIDVYSSWLERYPCPQPPGSLAGHELQDMWTDLQATSRVTSQINILQYCVQSENFTPAWLSTFLVAFSDCVECIRANYYHTEASNHRLFEVQAVLYAGLMMPEFANAQEWTEEAAADIARQIEIQFTEDGMQSEMDPSYHISVLEMFREMYTVAEANGRLDIFPAGYMDRLHAPARFVMNIIYPDYSIDNFNDTRSASWTRRVLLRNLGHYADMFPDDTELEWMATEGVSGTVPEDLTTVYPDAGWCMMRSGWNEEDMMLVLKNNDKFKNTTSSSGWWHCQPDNGTVGLYRNGRRFLPDAGSYSYGGGESDEDARDEFRATSAHNTVTRNRETIEDSNVRGKIEMAVSGAPGGELLCGSGSITCEGADVCDAVVSVNDSYSDMSHRRSVFFVDRKYFVVVDEVYGEGGGFPAILSWHLCSPEDGSTDPEDAVSHDSYEDGTYGVHTLFSDGNNMIFKTFCENTEDCGTETGVSAYSDSIGETVERPFYRVSMQKPAGETVRFATVVLPYGDPSSFGDSEISLRFLQDSRVEVSVDGDTCILGYTL